MSVFAMFANYHLAPPVLVPPKATFPHQLQAQNGAASTCIAGGSLVLLCVAANRCSSESSDFSVYMRILGPGKQPENEQHRTRSAAFLSLLSQY